MKVLALRHLTNNGLLAVKHTCTTFFFFGLQRNEWNPLDFGLRSPVVHQKKKTFFSQKTQLLPLVSVLWHASLTYGGIFLHTSDKSMFTHCSDFIGHSLPVTHRYFEDCEEGTFTHYEYCYRAFAHRKKGPTAVPFPHS